MTEKPRNPSDPLGPLRKLIADPDLDEVEKYLERLQPGWGLMARYFRKWPTDRHGKNTGKVTLKPLSVERVSERLEPLKTRIENGETFAILAAIELCASENLPLPAWLANAFNESLRQYTKPDGETDLGRVFYSSHYSAKTTRKAFDARQDHELAGLLWIACWRRARADKGITSMAALIRAVLADSRDGGPWGVKQRKAYAMVVEFDRNQAELLGKREKQPLARFLSKRCKALKGGA